MTQQLAYDLIAVDLDGTLLDARGELPARNRQALHAAHAAGMKVVLCTGRSYTETRPVIERIGLDLDACVTVSGALITDAVSGRTIERRTMLPTLVADYMSWLQRREYTLLWLHDAAEAGYDGYVLRGRRHHPVIDRWLEKTPCAVRAIEALPAEYPPPLRLTIVDEDAELRIISEEITQAFAGRLTHNLIEVSSLKFMLIEAFASPVDKWYGIERLCSAWRIDPARTVAIGDDVNDLPMIRHAGLGVAVGNAKPAVLDAAAFWVASNTECGVAALIDEILSKRARSRATP